MPKVGDLFIALGFQVDDKALKNFNDNIKTGTLALGAMSAAGAAAVYAIKGFTSSSVDMSVKLANLHTQTGVATEEVQRFYNVAGRLNTEVTLDDTINAFERLSDTIAQAKLGQGPIGEAGMLGLDNIGKQTPLGIIKALRENLANNVGAWGQGDDRVIQNLMKSIGLDPKFIATIRAPQADFDKLWNNPILNGDAQDSLVKLAQATKEFNFEWDLLKGNLSAEFAPTIIDFMQNLRTVLKETLDITGKVSDKFDEFKTKHDTTGAITRGVGNAAAVATGAGLLRAGSPYLKGVGGLILGVTAVQEAGSYMRGNPSSIGDAVGIWPEVRKALGAPFRGYAEEMMKTREQQEDDRRRLLNGEPMQSQSVGPQSNSTTINQYISTTADPRQAAQEIIALTDRRRAVEMQNNLGFNASGMVA